MLTTVPVIDVSPFLARTPSGERAVTRGVGQACEEIGFFTIVGHGVDRALVQRMHDVSKAFFDLPLEEQQKAR